MSREKFDAALAAIDEYNRDEDAPEPYAGMLEQECLIMAGGVLVRDAAAGVEVPPGCCFGLECWRDWTTLLDGHVLWLGHSPTPGLEIVDGVVRVWRDEERRDEPACEFPLGELPVLLEGVRQDLVGFLGLVRDWAPHELGEALAARFDEEFHVSAPL